MNSVNIIIESDDVKGLAPAVGKVGTVVFIRKAKKLWGMLSDNYSDSKVIKLCLKVSAPEYIVDIFPSLVGGYACYMGEGALFPSPIKILKIWKVTFKGCIRMSGGNQIASCLLATAVTSVSLFPKYAFHGQLVAGSHAFIRMAYSTVKEIDEVLEDAEFIKFLGNRGYGTL